MLKFNITYCICESAPSVPNEHTKLPKCQLEQNIKPQILGIALKTTERFRTEPLSGVHTVEQWA